MDHITFFISSLGSGGAERVVSTLASELTDRGYRVSIVLIANRNRNYALPETVQLRYLDCNQDLKKNALLRWPLRLKKIRRAIRELQPDLVISFMSETNIDVCLAALGLRLPIIVSERNDPAIDPASKAKQLLRRIAYLRAQGFVFQTPDARDYFSRRIRQAGTIILNPLTAKIPQPFEGVREKRIAAVGRLNAQKNYPLLLQAFGEFSKEYPDYTLEIYGQGNLEAQVTGEIARLGLEGKVILKGFCADVHNAIRTAAFYVMSSDFEGMPNALIEAMALGLPCICTDCPCGGPRMLIEDGQNGLLVPIRDPQALTTAMKQMAAHPEQAAQMGKQAQKVRTRVEVTAITDQWVEYMNSVGK